MAEVWESPYPADPKCSICGDPAHALWRGHELIAICRDCAIRDLPRLIADAIAGIHGNNTVRAGLFHRSVPRILGAFWMAAATAISSRVPDRVSSLNDEGDEPIYSSDL